jgi:hypothetical protein
MFHHILGEDAKYLSDGEEIGSQELFDTLNRRSTYTGEDGEGDSELKYLDMMRKLRDENPDLFEKIKRLPKKARSGSNPDGVEEEQLLTFFRIGKLKKFFINQNGRSSELTFFEAATLAECESDTKRIAIPENYYHLLETNKQRFRQDTQQSEAPIQATRGGRSNIKYVETRLKDPAFKHCKKFTDLDEDFLASVKTMIKQGMVAKKVAQVIKKEFEKTVDPLEMLASLRKHVRVLAKQESGKNKRVNKREIVLSVYQMGNQK